MNLKSFSTLKYMPTFEGMPETQGYRAGLPEEGGFRFEKIGPGPYTLLVVVGQSIFRTPLVVGEQEQTFTVDIPG